MLKPFRYHHGINVSGLIVLLAVHVIVLFNVASHDPLVMYDSGGHYNNIKAYSEIRFPTNAESHEYHSGPIPYLVPALAYNLSNQINLGESVLLAEENSAENFIYRYFLDSFEDVDLAIAGKVGQLQFFFVSLVLFYYVAKVTKLINPASAQFQTLTFLFIAILPVYYRSFTFIRGEPFVAMWTAIFVYHLLRDEINASNIYRKSLLLGIIIGLATLSRQAGAFLGIALVLYLLPMGLNRTETLKKLLLGLTIATSAAVAIASVFYVQYFIQSDYSFTPSHVSHSRYPLTLNFSNVPPNFYYSLSLDELFGDPVRPSFGNQFIPRFYSDVFGDFAGHFLIYGWDINEKRFVPPRVLGNIYYEAELVGNDASFPPYWLETNRIEFSRYLGKVMIYALIPGFLLLAGWKDGLMAVINEIVPKADKKNRYRTILFWIINVNMFGLLLTSLIFASGDASGVKATYVVQLFPVAAILAADFVHGQGNKMLNSRTVTIMLILFFVFSFSTYFTKYISWLRY